MRVARLEVNAFRGIPRELTCEFSRKGNVCSALISGDNGVGKSSIIDGIEFALQGRLSQGRLLTSRRRPAILSFANSRLPSVTVKLSDGQIITRTVVKDEEAGYLAAPNRPHPAFSVSPFVIRRADILRFLDTSEGERKLVFWNYLRDPSTKEW